MHIVLSKGNRIYIAIRFAALCNLYIGEFRFLAGFLCVQVARDYAVKSTNRSIIVQAGKSNAVEMQ